MAPQPVPISVHQDIINIPFDDDDDDCAIKTKKSNEIIDIDSSYEHTYGTTYWNQVACYNDESDSKIFSSVKTESSTSNRSISRIRTPQKPSVAAWDAGWSPWKK